MHTRVPAGFTLLELLLTLTLLGVSAGMAYPVARRGLDRLAVESARNVGMAAVHRTRVEARRRGGASLEVQADSGLFRVRSGGSVLWRWAEAGESGVEIRLSRGRIADRLDFDARGLGRVTSRTITFVRGEAVAALVVSSRGRVSRR
jgi:prepilin-type N-terminal cleavage/methylation domain-containing protein